MFVVVGAVTAKVSVQPPAGIRPPAAKVTEFEPEVAVITLVTVVPMLAQAPVFNAFGVATAIPAGNRS